MRSIVLATQNIHKIQEVNQLLASTVHIQFTLVPQGQFQVPDVEETGLTFVENALIKARHAAKHTGLSAIADDSGLEVPYLKGEPGIYSARYAGVGSSDGENLQKLLKQMQGVPEPQRLARFHCCMVFLRHEADPVPIISHATWQGRILEQAVGSNGFGYDPVFYVEPQQCSAAELSSSVKNNISHRGQALTQLGQLLRAELN